MIFFFDLENASMENLKLTFLLMVLVLNFSGCKKQENKCEKWEVEYYCIPTAIFTICSPTRNLTIRICNESDLGDAHAGRETLIFEGSGYKEMRKYIRRVS